MNIRKENRDLFTVPQGYYLAHCISGDYSLGAGIAEQFAEVYNMRFKLHKQYPLPDEVWANDEHVGQALLVDNVFNLVTKGKVRQRPTYQALADALEDMRYQCEIMDITKLAMPRIGCGLDGMEWVIVEELIKDIFEDMDIDILICEL